MFPLENKKRAIAKFLGPDCGSIYHQLQLHRFENNEKMYEVYTEAQANKLFEIRFYDWAQKRLEDEVAEVEQAVNDNPDECPDYSWDFAAELYEFFDFEKWFAAHKESVPLRKRLLSSDNEEGIVEIDNQNYYIYRVDDN